MRINTRYSKLSIAMIIVAILAIILCSFELKGFEGLFLIYVFLFLVIGAEAIDVLSKNTILKGMINVLILMVSGYGFFFLIMIGLIVFFGAAGGKFKDVSLNYILLMLCNIVLFLGCGGRLLKLFNGKE